MAWTVDVAAAKTLLSSAEGTLELTEPAKDAVNSALEAVESTLAGECEDIVAELSTLRTDVMVNDMTDTMTRGNNAIQGTGASVKAFQSADTEMRDRAQSMAASVPVAGPPVGGVPAGKFNFGAGKRTVES
ncbi:DUF6507 family protein [Arthrobacter sp.]|uniref:DUF6507 family protein n=1 Tax=Arthrobacter sp. TaxID=1667 RepID=UPI003A8D82E4